MISELLFSRDYGSFWRNLTPTMDGLIRKVNSGLYEREFPSMGSMTAPARRGFINQIAFDLFHCRVLVSQKRGQPVKPEDQIREIGNRIYEEMLVKSASTGSYALPLSDSEVWDILEQNKRLDMMFFVNPGTLLVSPKFSGCGIVNSCLGDVVKSTTLWEVKAGNRDFRAIDFRQLLTYSALNFSSKQYKLDALGLFNPRTGKSVQVNLEVLCSEVSGRDASDFLSSLVYAISSGGISR